MRSKKLEKEIERDFMKLAKKFKRVVRVLKFVSPGFTGVPDRIVFIKGGHIFFIEFKRPDTTLNKRQIRVIRWLIGWGFKVYVCDNKGQAEDILLAWLPEQGH